MLCKITFFELAVFLVRAGLAAMAMCTAANAILHASTSLCSAPHCVQRQDFAMKWFHVDCEDAASRNDILSCLSQPSTAKESSPEYRIASFFEGEIFTNFTNQ